MVTMTLRLDPDNPQEVAQAQGVLDRLAALATEPGPAESEESVAAAAIADLLARTGSGSSELIRVTAELGEFTIAVLADALAQSPTSTRSRFANLGRSLKAMQKAVPGAPKLYSDDKDDDGVWHFTMPEAYRNIILGDTGNGGNGGL